MIWLIAYLVGFVISALILEAWESDSWWLGILWPILMPVMGVCTIIDKNGHRRERQAVITRRENEIAELEHSIKLAEIKKVRQELNA